MKNRPKYNINDGYKTNYIVIDSFDMPVDFYEFGKMNMV